MRNDCPNPAPTILEQHPNQHSSRQSLHCQHRRHETTILQAARKKRGSKASQRLYRPSEGLGGCQGGAPVPGASLCPRNHRSEVISRHHDDLLAGYFGIDKTRELVGRKYYWQSLKKDVKNYVRGCDVCLTSKTFRHKPYGDLQSLLVSTHQ